MNTQLLKPFHKTKNEQLEHYFTNHEEWIATDSHVAVHVKHKTVSANQNQTFFKNHTPVNEKETLLIENIKKHLNTVERDNHNNHAITLDELSLYTNLSTYNERLKEHVIIFEHTGEIASDHGTFRPTKANTYLTGISIKQKYLKTITTFLNKMNIANNEVNIFRSISSPLNAIHFFAETPSHHIQIVLMPLKINR